MIPVRPSALRDCYMSAPQPLTVDAPRIYSRTTCPPSTKPTAFCACLSRPGMDDWAALRPSDVALRAKNPIRRIVETLVKPNLPDKPHIPLSLGERRAPRARARIAAARRDFVVPCSARRPQRRARPALPAPRPRLQATRPCLATSWRRRCSWTPSRPACGACRAVVPDSRGAA